MIKALIDWHRPEQLRLKLVDLLEHEQKHHRFDLATSGVVRTERSDKTLPQAIVKILRHGSMRWD